MGSLVGLVGVVWLLVLELSFVSSLSSYSDPPPRFSSPTFPKPPIAIVLTMNATAGRGAHTFHLLQQLFTNVLVVYPPSIAGQNIQSNRRAHVQAAFLGELLIHQGLAEWVWIFEDDVAVAAPLGPQEAAKMILDFHKNAKIDTEPYYVKDLVYGGGCIPPKNWKRCWFCLHAYAVRKPDHFNETELGVYSKQINYLEEQYPILKKNHHHFHHYNSDHLWQLPSPPKQEEKDFFGGDFNPKNVFPVIFEGGLYIARKLKKPLDSSVALSCRDHTRGLEERQQEYMLGRNMYGNVQNFPFHAGMFYQDRDQFPSSIWGI